MYNKILWRKSEIKGHPSKAEREIGKVESDNFQPRCLRTYKKSLLEKLGTEPIHPSCILVPVESMRYPTLLRPTIRNGNVVFSGRPFRGSSFTDRLRHRNSTNYSNIRTIVL